MNSVRAAMAAAICLILVAGCGFGHPYTSIYAENADAVPYVLRFEGQGFLAVLMSLPSEGQGGVFSEPGDVSGKVELLTVDCKVVSTATTGRGPVQITVVGGALRVASGVDLSQKPGTMLVSDDRCAAQHPVAVGRLRRDTAS